MADNAASHHHPVPLAKRLESKAGAESHLGDFLLGAVDGCVTTFAIVSGVAGAGLPQMIALVLGFSNLLADGFSMAAGNYQKAKSDRELIDKVRNMENKHIDEVPEEERDEIREIFARKGFDGSLLDDIVRVITKDRKRWVDTMIMEEFGLQLESANPLRSALVTFAAFVLVGLVPLTPFFSPFPLSSAQTFSASAAATGCAFLAIGAVKGRLRHKSLALSALETLFVGGSAAALAYGIGAMLRHVTGITV